MTVHSVAELREAWRAIEGGEFAHGPRSAPTARSAATVWTPAPSERVVAVVGCAGGVGASTFALALATATGASARVVECCPPLASGFSAAANAELGTEGPWRRGSRGDVLLERPIIGDATHGKGPLNRWWAERLGQQRLWLHAWQLTVPHPVSGVAMTFDSGLPWPGPAGWGPGHDTAEIANASPVSDWQRLFARLPWEETQGTPTAP